jgi:hypothetical protein
MSNNLNIISVDDSDNIVFEVPIKVGNYEIKPSEGGVLENGVPYQGISGVFGAREYIAIKKTLTTEIVMGTPIDFVMTYDSIKDKKKVFMYVDPPGNLIFDKLFRDWEMEFMVTITGVDPSSPPFIPIFYTNTYTPTPEINAIYSDISTPTLLKYSVSASYLSRDGAFGLYEWAKPADSGLFMELTALP